MQEFREGIMKLVKEIKKIKKLRKAGNLRHQQNLWEEDGTWYIMTRTDQKAFWSQVPKKYRNKTSRHKMWSTVKNFTMLVDWHCGANPDIEVLNILEVWETLKYKHNFKKSYELLKKIINKGAVIDITDDASIKVFVD
jgi:hypothetical protein